MIDGEDAKKSEEIPKELDYINPSEQPDTKETHEFFEVNINLMKENMKKISQPFSVEGSNTSVVK